MDNLELKLTKAEIAEGWHFCPEWDFLLIHPKDTEYKFCLCKEYNKFKKD